MDGYTHIKYIHISYTDITYHIHILYTDISHIMNRINDHISLSKKVIRCKSCKTLMLIRYLDNVLCEKCEKEYNKILRKMVLYQK